MAQTTATGIIVAKTATAIYATKAITTNTRTMVAIKMLCATTTLVAKRRTSSKSPKRSEMTTYAITSKRRTRSCTMTTSLL
jgi:hypothetical protein